MARVNVRVPASGGGGGLPEPPPPPGGGGAVGEPAGPGSEPPGGPPHGGGGEGGGPGLRGRCKRPPRGPGGGGGAAGGPRGVSNPPRGGGAGPPAIRSHEEKWPFRNPERPRCGGMLLVKRKLDERGPIKILPRHGDARISARPTLRPEKLGGRSRRKVRNGLVVEGCLWVHHARGLNKDLPNPKSRRFIWKISRSSHRIHYPRAQRVVSRGSQPLSRHRTFDGRGGAVKGVGKFGEVMAGEKGDVDIDVVLEKLRRVIRSGSQPKAIFDFVLKELRRSFARYTWAGVYMGGGAELVLKAWSRPHATQHVPIPIGEGICGLAARTGETVVVGDVSKDPRYLECFPETRSEIVVPILRDGIAIGEIDIDSDALEAFSEEDRAFVEELADELAKVL